MSVVLEKSKVGWSDSRVLILVEVSSYEVFTEKRVHCPIQEFVDRAFDSLKTCCKSENVISIRRSTENSAIRMSKQRSPPTGQ